MTDRSCVQWLSLQSLQPSFSGPSKDQGARLRGFRISPQASRARGGPSLFVGSRGRSHQEAVCVVFDGKVMEYTRTDIVMLAVTTMAVAYLLYVILGKMN